MTTKKDEKQEPEPKLNELIIFPTGDSETKSRTLGVYGEVDEEHCKTVVSGLYYFRDTAEVEEIEEPVTEDLLQAESIEDILPVRGMPVRGISIGD